MQCGTKTYCCAIIRTVNVSLWIFGYPQIVFDELTVQMERCWVGSVAAS